MGLHFTMGLLYQILIAISGLTRPFYSHVNEKGVSITVLENWRCMKTLNTSTAFSGKRELEHHKDDEQTCSYNMIVGTETFLSLFKGEVDLSA